MLALLLGLVIDTAPQDASNCFRQFQGLVARSNQYANREDTLPEAAALRDAAASLYIKCLSTTAGQFDSDPFAGVYLYTAAALFWHHVGFDIMASSDLKSAEEELTRLKGDQTLNLEKKFPLELKTLEEQLSAERNGKWPSWNRNWQ